ncbi:tRNA (N6-isopentenyl adenosine(37)-C2)-methylthiotransferase MiaB [Mucilaginibacter rubeus]|uniref:tRNA-2-methylthio-N(6)-dimethylallyladenosine synthase n=1 Tax=Mucilaginibacter rubeus TaxID=2027860 RepID=A0AAE6JHM3_9SPHI|nr:MULTISPECIES: MiaB/RimO family radical SAM methylthiotransferase [Mucilaginibacter]QEM05874.1 tRNA (N6-isopentenyl adenosine(37)-C2)-methylthiotransferase MiaB [Mucilaginibacter rubeus]QEM18455.1 tRNA (N6-isopentenyl adenosine(37)-C2)-methylthiotransferase MiaB [Mucilaginibacter gossypii]QTE45006.1 tRNA (N6-isopentenyl adenosine(37)-C2)-methylthiotransferase MiaB [Mucilaginibacter rubeus]QTE51603.1 tRNA (N6-isopentenyl adenosine(37)-C2)-methylthiotransferase MiaB [Mucilaginibacter rubeus]QT
MMDLLIPDKTHDESRQGEALMLKAETAKNNGRKLYIESYGCAMNFSDSEIVASILAESGFETTADYSLADVIFINTCSIRENAEQRVRNRLKEFTVAKVKNPGLVVGVLGCMAERLKSKFLEEEKLVDVVVGPDAYRDLPNLINQVDDGQKAVNVLLSREETYADISPVRLNSNGINAFVSIMRGCDNMCSFCVVPFTRGRERSRDPLSIVAECRDLFDRGYREVTLLGQNVDSYKWTSPQPSPKERALEGQIEAGVENDSSLPLGEVGGVNFAKLLEMVALIDPDLRVRFSTSHPKDITDEVLHAINKYDNICNYIHLPVQSGNSRILDLMNRTYDREWYINRIDAIRRIIPDCAISTDVITGFCSETDEEHKDTVSMMDYVKYDFAYMFKYSERPGTLAAKRYADDIPEDVKQKRLTEIVAKQQEYSFYRMQARIGRVERVLIEGFSKKSDKDYCGRSDQNAMVIFPVGENYKPGQYVNVLIERSTTATLIGKVIPQTP